MLPDINLLPKYERENSLSYLLFIIGLILCLVLIIGLAIFYFTTKNNLESSEQTLSQLNEEKSMLEAQIASIETDNNSESVQDVITYVEQHIVPTSYLIDELMNVLPNQGYLSNFNYNYQSVDIETQFEKMNDAAAYVVALNQSEFIKDVKVNQINTFELGATTNEEENVDDYYHTMPRYSVSYSIEVDQASLREEGENHE